MRGGGRDGNAGSMAMSVSMYWADDRFARLLRKMRYAAKPHMPKTTSATGTVYKKINDSDDAVVACAAGTGGGFGVCAIVLVSAGTKSGTVDGTGVGASDGTGVGAGDGTMLAMV